VEEQSDRQADLREAGGKGEQMTDLKQNDKSTWSWNVMRLQRGPLTDNGATPWYTVLRLGSERQELKFAIDTGTTHSWVTSIQCTTQACLNHRRFDFRSSTSFKQLTSPYSPDEISFGPWGTMQVTLGSDRVEFTMPKTENIYDIDPAFRINAPANSIFRSPAPIVE